jgi:hypothetical protein
MVCNGCGTQPAVVGQFCSTCDNRARYGLFERRRPLGGSQWQALWGIDYAEGRAQAKRRRQSQSGIALTVIALALFLAL